MDVPVGPCAQEEIPRWDAGHKARKGCLRTARAFLPDSWALGLLKSLPGPSKLGFLAGRGQPAQSSEHQDSDREDLNPAGPQVL